jgi:hypothetical protein
MLTKFASFGIIDKFEIPSQTSRSVLRRMAHRVEFDYEPRPGFLYVRSRAISSRCNDNFDEFPADEIKVSYRTFVGKPVFVNHHNDNHRRARGVIIDAKLHEDRAPDGSPDTWCEVLMEVDAVRFPKLAKAILAGHIDRTSMGTDVAFSKCSFCGNKATTPLEYCSHIPALKGKRIVRTTASGKKEGILVREICYGLKFFENSLLVEEPADPTAYFLGVEAGPGVVGPTAVKVAQRKQAHEGENAYQHTHMQDIAPVALCTSCGKHITQLSDGWHGMDGTSPCAFNLQGHTPDEATVNNGGRYREQPDEAPPSQYEGSLAAVQDQLAHLNIAQAIINANAKIAGLSPISDCKSCGAKKGTHCDEGCDGVRLYRGDKTPTMKASLTAEAISDVELNDLTDLPKVDLPGRGSRGHCKRCGAPLANSLESSVGLCPACEDGGGRRQPVRQKQRMVRTNDGRTERTGKQTGVSNEDGDLHTGVSWGQLRPGDKVIGLDGSIVKTVQPTTGYHNVDTAGARKVRVGLTHPERGDFERVEPHWTGDLNIYRLSRRMDGPTERTALMMFSALTKQSYNIRHTQDPFEYLKNKFESYQGRRNHVPLPSPNTHLWKDEAGNYHVKYYNTNVVSYSPDGRYVTYRHNGWTTSNTTKRMNSYGHQNHSITLSQRAYRTEDVPEGRQRTNIGPRVFTGMGRGSWGPAQYFNGKPHVTIDTHAGHESVEDHVPDNLDPVPPPRRRGSGDYSAPRRSRPRPSESYPAYDPHTPTSAPTPSSDTSVSDSMNGYGWNVSHEDMPQEGEDFYSWVNRTAPKPKFDNCTRCNGRGKVGPYGQARDCSKCRGSGYLDNEGKPFDPGRQGTRPVQGDVDMRSPENPERRGGTDPVLEHSLGPAPQRPVRDDSPGMTTNRADTLNHISDYHGSSLHHRDDVSDFLLRDHHDMLHQNASQSGWNDGQVPHVHQHADFDSLQSRWTNHRGPARTLDTIPTNGDDGHTYECSSCGAVSRGRPNHPGGVCPMDSGGGHMQVFRSPAVDQPLRDHMFRSHNMSDAHDDDLYNTIGATADELHRSMHAYGDEAHPEGWQQHSHDDAGLGVGHVWTNTSCPAYRSQDGADCTCNNQPRGGNTPHDYHASGNSTDSPCSTCGGEALSDPHMNQRTSMKHQAYGEMMAPRDVDTLRDEECPVCAEKDSYDGDQCQVCGFVKPPAMFMDPNLEMAKQIDLRKDNDPQGATSPLGDPLTPGGNQANPMDPNAVDAQGMPNEVPGSGVPGSDTVPLDPANLDPNGLPMQPMQGNPLQPGMLPMTAPQPGMNSPTQKVGPDGQPIIDPNTGLPLTGVPGPAQPGMGQPGLGQSPTGMPMEQPGQQTDIYGQPLGPMGPVKPGQGQVPVDPATGLPIDPVTGQPTSMEPLPPEQVEQMQSQQDQLAQQANPGQVPGAGMAPDGQTINPELAEDNVVNLVCPMCGFTTAAAQPMSTTEPMGQPTGDVADGAQEGDVCPQCGKALLMAEDDGADEMWGKEHGMLPQDEAEGDAPEAGGDFNGEEEPGQGAPDKNADGIADDDEDEDEPEGKKSNPFGRKSSGKYDTCDSCSKRFEEGKRPVKSADGQKFCRPCARNMGMIDPLSR